MPIRRVMVAGEMGIRAKGSLCVVVGSEQLTV
jgi:hypothetical protein